MIVHRAWGIDRPNPNAPTRTYRVEREGWFLFGFIPLYIRDRVYE